MNRPSFFTYIVGNPVSLIAVWLLAAFLAYQWYANSGSGVPPVIIGLAAIAASNAYQRIETYRLWKREWDAMNGVASTSPVAGGFMRKTGFRLIIGGVIWCAFAYAAVTVNTSTGRTVAGLFWIGTLVLVVMGIYRFIRRALPVQPKKNNIRDVPVTQCLAVPRQSPTPSQAFAALPDYCLLLIGKRTRAGAASCIET